MRSKDKNALNFFIFCYYEFENLQNHTYTADSDDGIAPLREYRSTTRPSMKQCVARVKSTTNEYRLLHYGKEQVEGHGKNWTTQVKLG